jgi:hypothetical protein
VALGFEGIVTNTPHRAQQTVNLAPLRPGNYVLTLSIEIPGREARARREVPLRILAR